MPHAKVFVPLVTPLTETGDVCQPSVERLLTSCHPSASGYIPCLTSGEGWRLSREQWVDMLRFTLAGAKGKAVIAGIERATTDEVLACAAEAKQLGARAIMLTSSFGGTLDQAGIEHHFRQVHDGCGLDVYLYNESTLSGNRTDFETLLKIAALPRVVGVKDSAEGGHSADQIRALQAHGVAYFVGMEQQLATGLPADGCVVSLANLEPALCQIALTHSHAGVRDAVARLSDVYGLFNDDWYRYVKKTLHARGVIGSDRLVGEP